MVASVDTPLSRATVRALIDAWRALPGPGAIVVPRHGGRNGHPGLFDGALLPELRAVQEESQGLRAVRRAHTKTTTFLDVDDPLVTLNLNTNLDHPGNVDWFVRHCKRLVDEQGYADVSIRIRDVGSCLPNVEAPIAAVVDYYKQRGINFLIDEDRWSPIHFRLRALLTERPRRAGRR